MVLDFGYFRKHLYARLYCYPYQLLIHHRNGIG